MNEDYLSTELQVSPDRMKKFIKHLGIAAENVKKSKRVVSRKDFLSKIEELSGERLAHHEHDDLSTIESKLKRLEEIEKATLQTQKSDEVEIIKLKNDIEHEGDLINNLNAKIQLLEKRLSESELRRVRQLKESKEKMLALTHMLSDLNLKLGSFDKKKISPDLKPIKMQLKKLEDFYKKLKKSKKHGKSDLLRVENKIKELKALINS